MSLTPKEQITRDRAKAHGAEYATAIIEEAKRAGLSVPLAFALVEQESGFQNIFGHDPSGNHVGAGKVTKAKYLDYKRQRGPTGKGGMQGVGLTQITHWALQDRADHEGGAWKVHPQLRVAFEYLKETIDRNGLTRGLGVYNGGEVHPRMEFAQSVMDLYARWHRRLT